MKKIPNLRTKGKLMFSQVILLATLFSCSKTDMQNELEQKLDNNISVQQDSIPRTQPNAFRTTNLLYEENFEGSTYFPNVGLQNSTSYGFTVTPNPFNKVGKAGRFELRDTDPLASSGTRSEVSIPREDNVNKWYVFKVYFPSEFYQKDSKSEIITQFHQGGGESPSIAFEIRDDKYRIIVRPKIGVSEKFDLGLIKKDRWNSFVVHINHSAGSDGNFEIWLDGVKVLSRTGANMYPLVNGIEKPKWKFGIYKWDWNGSGTTDVSKRVLYFDDIKIYNGIATLQEVNADNGTTTIAPAPTTPTSTPIAPAPTMPTPTAPTPTAPALPPAPVTTASSASPVVSFTLVNSGTEKDIMTITNGAKISLKQIGTTKLNIRANTTTAKQGSIKFELAGAYNYTYSDSYAPYAIFNDDKYGNYYYNKPWSASVVGSYTLKATPYSDEKGKGTASPSYSINFTITE